MGAQWVFNFVVSQSFPVMKAAIGLPSVFSIYSAVCASKASSSCKWSTIVQDTPCCLRQAGCIEIWCTFRRVRLLKCIHRYRLLALDTRGGQSPRWMLADFARTPAEFGPNCFRRKGLILVLSDFVMTKLGPIVLVAMQWRLPSFTRWCQRPRSCRWKPSASTSPGPLLATRRAESRQCTSQAMW